MSSTVRRNKVNVSDFLIFTLRHVILYSPVVWGLSLPVAMVWSAVSGDLAAMAVNIANNYLAAGGAVLP